MPLARVTVWSPGQVLMATALNGEFDGIVNQINNWPTTYTIGDLLQADSGTTLARLASVAAGSYLRSGGVATASVWSTLTLPNAATTGDIPYASASNVLSMLASVATGSALISGGVATAPSWGKIGLTTHVSGDLPYANLTAAGAASKILGRGSAAGAGDWEEITLGSNLSMSGTTLSASGGSGGIQHIWIDAGAMIPRITNGPSRGFTEQTTNKNNHESLDFDTTTQEFAQFKWRMPKSWNESTVTFIPVWTAASGSGTVVWALQAVATSNDDALDVAFGTEQTSTDTLLAANDEHEGPESSAITIAGTPAEGDLVTFQIKRNVADDTLGVDAKLLGIILTITTNADTDA